MEAEPVQSDCPDLRGTWWLSDDGAHYRIEIESLSPDGREAHGRDFVGASRSWPVADLLADYRRVP